MSADFNWMQAAWTSPILLSLVACSVIALAMVLERAIYYRRRRGNPDATLAEVSRKVREGNVQQAAWVCSTTPHPMGAVARAVLEAGDADAETVEERLQLALSEQRLLLERNLGTIGTLAGTTPLIGLLGTVWGIMRSFNDIAVAGSSAPAVVSAGIAEALFTTAAGLIIAVPALVAYNYFARAMHVMLTVAENHARGLRMAWVEPSSRESRGVTTRQMLEASDVERLKDAVDRVPAGMHASPRSR
jgi:biopolymer transport protein ExbB